MSNETILAKLWDLGLKAIDEKVFEIVDVEFVKESGHWYVRYYIDKPGGVTLDDCQLVSQEVSRLLDNEDPIPHSYILEVSSPGAERPLKKDEDFIKYIGSYVEIKTFEKIEGKKVFTGFLKDFSNNVIHIEDGENYAIPKEIVSSAKLKIRWDGDLK
ncbi:MAG TPA: ribosome maturation factor RimP [Thermoanaerobacterales bacterium]|nr:ribosome maturation factor RimP [Thermoanaerobacterales bacterium]